MRDRTAVCSECGKPVWRGRTSADTIVCLVCRRKSSRYQERQVKRNWTSQDRECPICRVIFAQDRPNQVYCSASCRESRRNWSNETHVASAEDRGYGKAHREERARWKPIVEAGHASCCLCGRPIDPGTTWHLDHNEDRSGYRGVAHQACNVRDGASRAARRSNANRPTIERTCKGCHRAFTTIYPRQRYCSRECKPKREGKPRRCSVTFTSCTECGSLFTARTSRAVLCSEECRTDYWRRALREKYRAGVGIALDAPLSGRGRPRGAAKV